MRKTSYLVILLLTCAMAVSAAEPQRRLFDCEKREGDTRPKPDLSPRAPSLAGKGSGVRSKAKAPGLSAEASAKAGWQPNGILVCDTANCSLPKIVPDGNSGAIICWTENYRGADSVNRTTDDIYAQRVDSGGNFVWPSQGVPVCSLSNSYSNYPAMISDGQDGAIIAWEDGRGSLGYTQVFAQRLDNMGNRLWPENGVLVCNQMSGYVDICTDGHGGAIIAYVDGRDEANTSDNIYAQRIDSAGNPVWQIDGVPVCTADSSQFWPFISSNGDGGAIITWWDDYRNGAINMDAYGQMLNKLGAAKWAINGDTFSLKAGNQKSFKSISGNNGKVLVGWYDYSELISYMQCIDSNNIKQWVDTGVVIGNYSKMNIDGRGGGIVSNGNYVNRIDSIGNIQWSSGVALHETLPSGGENNADVDGQGGIVAIWNFSTHLYAQRVDSNGLVLWNATGVPVCTTMDTRNYQQVCSDHMGGALAAWYGWAPGALYPMYSDILAQRVYPNGIPGGVTGEPFQSSEFRIQNVIVYPNPFITTIDICYSLVKQSSVSLRVYNINGQFIKTITEGERNIGKYQTVWHGKNDSGCSVASGLYILCVTVNGLTKTTKILKIK